nr:hypothetical protein [Desulfobulbaceae bacterium]
MKKSLIIWILVYLVGAAVPALSATVTCEVEEVSGSTIILKNCDERAKGFEKGRKVKVKMQQEKGTK